MRLIDIGANLADASFDPDRDEVIKRADPESRGVARMIITGGAGLNESEQALALASESETGEPSAARRAYTRTWPRNGPIRRIRPANASGRVSWAIQLAVAAGECGLDYFRNLSPPEAQRAAFAGQLELAAKHGKPVFLHQRDAHDDFLAILKEHEVDGLGGVAHCFTGGPEQAESYLELGLYIGITGWVLDERRNHELLKAIPLLPLDRVLLETDSPYLLPRHPDVKPQRKRRNEPEFLPYVARALADKMRVDPEELAAAACYNTRKLFGWPEPEDTHE